MDAARLTDSAAAPPAVRAWVWFGYAALAAYALLLGWNFANVAGGADSSGYLNSAKLLASGHLDAELRVPPEFGAPETLRRQQFQPHGFVPFEGHARLSPTYAVGLPLHLAAAGLLFGWNAAPAVVGLAGAVGALLLTYAIGRRLGLGAPLAVAGSVALGAYPVFLFMSLQPLSDTLATTWCLAAVWAALRAREHRGWAVACGAAFAVAVLVRLTNGVILPALLVLLGLDPRRLALAILGGLPSALWQAYYNHSLYDSPFRSGYVDISQAFGLAYGLPTAWHFVKWLALMLPSALLVLPFFALRRAETPATSPEPSPRAPAPVASASPLAPGRVLLALALWFFAFAILYAFYEISHEVWWCLRFILPGTPALILAGLLGFDALARAAAPARVSRVRTLGAVVLAAWALGLGWYWTARHSLLHTKVYEQAYADAAAAARQQFPADALVLAGLHSGSLYYYTSFAVMRWEFVNATEFAAFRAHLDKSRRPLCALLFDVEEREALQEKCPGTWEKIGAVRNIGLWRYVGPAVAAPATPPAAR